MAPSQPGAWSAEGHSHATESLASHARLCKGLADIVIPEARKPRGSGIPLLLLQRRRPYHASFNPGMTASGKTGR